MNVTTPHFMQHHAPVQLHTLFRRTTNNTNVHRNERYNYDNPNLLKNIWLRILASSITFL